MARAGGFAGTLDPFGSGNLGGFSQYDIGADLADLEVYRVEVKWGNGLATDEEYLAALTKARDATDVDTQRRESAQNKLDDAIYRIGRSKAEEQGLDQLIAFDQAALGKMNADNVRYRDVKESLDTELAQRRSRDYGALVDSYNQGKTTTQALLSWVTNALSGLTADDPDFDNWTGVRIELDERILDERDAKVYQDYQQRRIKGPEFLAYIQQRRDAYDPGSPKYEEWARKLEDATDNVRDTEFARKDAAFFNRYEEGKVSDKAYLKYLRQRIDGMEADDPQREEWRHRMKQAAFSIAEDTLRYQVERGREPVSKLVRFYRNYRDGLNPHSAEYRQITRAILSLGGGSGGGGGGGGGGGRAATGGGGAASARPKATGSPEEKRLDKLIDPRNTIKGNAGNLFRIDPTAKSGSIATAKKYLDLNMQSAGNAVRAGDAVWLFQDPRKPGDVVAGRYPDGSPMLDATGKPIMVRGSSYLPASNEIYANLKSIEADNWTAAMEYALARKDSADYPYFKKRAEEARDQARLADAMGREQSWDEWYKRTSEAVDHATRSGQYGLAVSLANDLAWRLGAEAQNQWLDDTRRARLDDIGDKLAANPLLSRSVTDPFTGRETVIAGALNEQDLQQGKITLNPGWHHVLKSDDLGRPDYGPVYSAEPEDVWKATHVTVQTKYGNHVVTGDVELRSAPTPPTTIVSTPEGRKRVPLSGPADYLSFQDERGQTVRAYSIDGGRTWIRPTAGTVAPMLEINVPLIERALVGGGKEYVSGGPRSGEVVLTLNADGTVDTNDAFFRANPGAVGWYGVAAWNAARSILRPNLDPSDRENARVIQLERMKVENMDVGAEGQHMMFITAGRDGSVNLLPGQWEYELRDDRPKVTRPGGAPGAYRPDVREAGGAPGAFRPDTSTGPDLGSVRGAPGAYRPGGPTLSRDVEWANLQSQLPSDTPPRYEGRGIASLGIGRSPILPSPKAVSTVVSPARPVIPPALKAAPVVNLGAPGAYRAPLPPVPKKAAAKPKPTVKKVGKPGSFGKKPSTKPKPKTPTGGAPGAYRQPPAPVKQTGQRAKPV